jgi:thymidylate synthase (FAD)
MELLKAKTEILSNIDREKILKSIEIAGRTCYKSEDRITEESASKFVKMIIGRGHESVIEHISLTVKFIIDRGVSHELVRHRLASFSQESTRYVNYTKEKHGGGDIKFIIPNWLELKEGKYKKFDLIANYKQHLWINMMLKAEHAYNMLIEANWTPQQARSVLPNSLKTEIVVTANLREWRLIFKQRTSKFAHPQMKEVMVPLYNQLNDLLPEIFENIN